MPDNTDNNIIRGCRKENTGRNFREEDCDYVTRSLIVTSVIIPFSKMALI